MNQDDNMNSLKQALNPSNCSEGGRVEKEHSFQELQAIESRRRQILHRSDLPYWRILMFIDGTCLRALSSDWLLFLTLSVFVGIRFQAWTVGMLPEFALGRLGISEIGGFLSFFLVLFVNQSNQRFQDMYKESKNACKRIYDLAATATTALPPAEAARLVRYINAAHAAGYVGLNQAYTKNNFFLPVNNTYHFLTPAELDLMNQQASMEGPEAFHLLCEWCLQDVSAAYDQKMIEVKDFVGLRDKGLALRSSMDMLYDYSDQPIHFFYIHFLILLSTLYLPLFAASNAYKAGAGDDLHPSADLLAGLIVLLQTIFVIGLRMLGRRLVEPYGTDNEDLSVLRYVEFAWSRSQKILNARFPTKVDAGVEEQLQGQRA